MDEAAYRTLSRIAPTVAPPAGYEDATTPSRAQIQLMIGRALGREEQALELNARIDALFAAALQAHPEFEGSTAVVAESFDMVRIRGSAEVWSAFLIALGFEVPDDVADPEFREISREQVEVLADLDALVWNLYSADDRAALDANPIYSGLDVAQEGRDVFVGPEDTISEAIGHNSALSLPLVIEAMVPRLAAAVDGDPATVVAP